MPEGLGGQPQRSAADALARRWARSVGLAAAVGVAYFLAARLSVGLVLKPEGVAVFWPAAGIFSGVLIALGPRSRWPGAGPPGGGNRRNRSLRNRRCRDLQVVFRPIGGNADHVAALVCIRRDRY